MVMPRQDVHAQNLHHRVVLIVVRDTRGRVYLQRRAASKPLHPGLWDVSAAGHVRAGESRKDAALRELHEELGITGVQLHERAVHPACAATEYSHVTLFCSSPCGTTPTPAPEEASEGMFVDADELLGLVEHCGDLITPGLRWVAQGGYLFPGSTS